MGSGLRVSREKLLMDVAEMFAERSTCSRAHVGVVIARDGRILTTGYNGAPSGLDHCLHGCNCTLMGGHHPDCSILKPCTIAVHAEANAIAYAARYGLGVEGCDLYTTLSPCIPCAQLIINAGIKRIYIKNKYRDMSGLNLLGVAGLDIIALYDR